MEGYGEAQAIKDRVNQIRKQIDETDSDFDRKTTGEISKTFWWRPLLK